MNFEGFQNNQSPETLETEEPSFEDIKNPTVDLIEDWLTLRAWIDVWKKSKQDGADEKMLNLEKKLREKEKEILACSDFADAIRDMVGSPSGDIKHLEELAKRLKG